MSKESRGGEAILPGLASKCPSKDSSVRPTGVVNLGRLTGAASEFAYANSDRLSPPKVEAGWAGASIPLLPPTGVVTWAALRGG